MHSTFLSAWGWIITWLTCLPVWTSLYVCTVSVCVCVCVLYLTCVNGCEKSRVIASSGRSVFCCPPVSFPTHPLTVLQLQSISIETQHVLIKLRGLFFLVFTAFRRQDCLNVKETRSLTRELGYVLVPWTGSCLATDMTCVLDLSRPFLSAGEATDPP